MQRSTSSRSKLLVAAVIGILFPALAASCAGDAEPQDGDAGSEKLPLSAQRQGTSPFWVVLRDKADVKAARKMADRGARGAFVVDHLKQKAQQSQAGILAYLDARSIPHESHWAANVLRVEADAKVARALAKRADVETLLPDVRFQIPPPVTPTGVTPAEADWNIQIIRADQAWTAFGTGEGIVVGSIDTGVDYTHVALVDHYRGNLGGGSFVHDHNWLDATGNCGPPGSPPCDDYGHGTHTMGTMVGGDGPVASGLPDIGVAPGAKWISAKACDYGGCSLDALLTAAEFMLAPTDVYGNDPDPAKRPHVVNNSWGDGPGDEIFRQVISNWVDAGIFPVFSIGNSGPYCGSAGSPGDYPESFSAGATDQWDTIGDFSSRGPSYLGGLKPDVAAPGVSVYSSLPGNEYGWGTGTSMAAPHVAGAVALIWSAAPALAGDIAATADVLRSTAVDLVALDCGGDPDGDPNNVYGEGRIDAFAAVEAAPRVAGTLSGTVTDSATGLPIEAAAIRAVRSDDGALRATKTGAAGEYTLKLSIDPAPGPEAYDVEASLFGYAPAWATVGVQQDQTTTQDFALVAAPKFTLSGTVLDTSAQPVAGATVQILNTPIPALRTGADGAFAFADVPQGDYEVRFREPCHDGSQQGVALTGDQVLDVTLPTHYDAFGYHCEAIPLDYVPGTTDIELSGEASYLAQSMPFAFPFYGRFHEIAYLSTSGNLNFSGIFKDWMNGTVPSLEPPNDAIYAFWDDLYVFDNVHSDVYGAAPDRVWVLDYPGAYTFEEGALATFEVKLFERTGDIEVHYPWVPGNATGATATIGIEDPTGSVGLQYAYNEPVIQQGMALRFVPPPAGTLTGQVADANDGLAVAGATVRALQGGVTVAETSTNAGGEYWLSVKLGTYTVEATRERYGAASADMTLGQDDGVATHDFALPTPRAEVAPATLEALVPKGTTRTAALTLRNTGTLPMTWTTAESSSVHVSNVAGAGEWLSPPGAGVQMASNLISGGLAHPSSYQWVPEGPPAGNVLVYTDDVVHSAPYTYVDQALQRIGAAYTAYYDGYFDGFAGALASGAYDLVIFDNEAYYPPDALLSALQGWAASGGKLVFVSPVIIFEPGHPLWTTLGVAFGETDYDPPDPVYWWDPGHPVFTTPESAPEYLVLDPSYYYNGTHVFAQPGFEALGGFTAGPADGHAALVLGNDSRTLFKGFLDGGNNADRDGDGTRDAVELWENIVVGIQMGFFVDLPWVGESPTSGLIEPGQAVTIQVTFDPSAVAAGVYEGSLRLQTNSGRDPDLVVPVRMVVPAYRAAVNAGGGAYVDAQGDVWSADASFVPGGFGYTNPKADAAAIHGDVMGTAEDALYGQVREDPWEYRFDGVPPGIYEIELGFAEPKVNGKVNLRLFDVIVEGALVLPSHDIVYEVGARTADRHELLVKVTDGQINVRLVSRKGYQPAVISAVRVTHRPDR